MASHPTRILTLLFLPILLLLVQCRFDKILQPRFARPGQVIEINLTISDNLVPEPNAHKGVLGILIPDDWTFVSGSYDGTPGSGALLLSPAWADSAEACYPAESFAGSMRWIALLSDSGYAYSQPISFDVKVQLKVGPTQGCFKLGYLLTKATRDLLCTNYTPLSYPHPIGVPDSCAAEATFRSERAPQWESLFDRTSGWTGADGIYSIPLNGDERPGPDTNRVTFFNFGDTFIGQVSSNDRRSNWSLINNTYALLKGDNPQTGQAAFFWDNMGGSPKTVFTPGTPLSKPSDWYWPMDGVAIGDSVYLFALRLDKNVAPFNVVGVNLLVFHVDPDSGIKSYRQLDSPLYYQSPADGWDIVLGQAVMPLTTRSGYSDPDGYIYVYGPRSSSLRKDVVVARVLPQAMTDFSRYEYWTADGWGSDIADCADISNFVSQEFSVSPWGNGRFIMAFMLNQSVAVRLGDSPVGPFDAYKIVWHCPEVGISENISVYNAKAHPHLSEPPALLISYNVNTNSFTEHIANADIYRPRFINLFLDDNATALEPATELLVKRTRSFELSPAYPNPFNSTTVVSYRLDKPGRVQLRIFDITGRRVKTLVDANQNSGNHQVVWSAENERKQSAGSALYIVRLEFLGQVISRKLVLLR